jgi:YesN/AraC family two-component response regulator
LYSFAKLSSVVTRENDLFLSLIKFIDNNYQNHSLNLDIVAKELGYHPKYISIKFKQFAGIGFNQYLSNTRIKHALQLLNYGIKSIKNVAILCGFNDPLYFSKVFKNIVGISPKDYLALNDENRNRINIM